MIDKLNFIYGDKGYTEEFENAKNLQRRLVMANGNNKEAFEEVYKQHKDRKNILMQDLESRVLNIMLSERALSELYEEFKVKGKLD